MLFAQSKKSHVYLIAACADRRAAEFPIARESNPDTLSRIRPVLREENRDTQRRKISRHVPNECPPIPLADIQPAFCTAKRLSLAAPALPMNSDLARTFAMSNYCDGVQWAYDLLIQRGTVRRHLIGQSGARSHRRGRYDTRQDAGERGRPPENL